MAPGPWRRDRLLIRAGAAFAIVIGAEREEDVSRARADRRA
jgi:hypothetical protein